MLCYSGQAESDMDLDLLAESESDSDSSRSNQDNASVQRSAVTAATAGSDAGLWKRYAYGFIRQSKLPDLLEVVSCNRFLPVFLTKLCHFPLNFILIFKKQQPHMVSRMRKL